MTAVPFRKGYKFSAEDVALLDELRARLSTADVQAPEINVIRAALRALKTQLDVMEEVKSRQKKNQGNR